MSASAPPSPAALPPAPPSGRFAARLAGWLDQRPAAAENLRRRMREALRHGGLDQGLAGEGNDGRPHPGRWEIDLVPNVINAAEWELLRNAVTQRARVVRALLCDVYGAQEALRRRVLPPEIVLADPFYRRPCYGTLPPSSAPATVARFDLVRTSSGWQFIDVWTNTALGLFLVVQNRRLMAAEAADLYAQLPPFQPVSDLPVLLLSTLRDLAPGLSRPNVAVLTAGPEDPYFGEHSFLARKMGVPLAHGDDLIVLGNQLYFKTIDGLEPVHVLYRRLNDAHIDPVVFRTSRSGAGIPGLLGCLRQGTVTVANAVGAGVAENRGLHAYFPRLTRYFLNERPLLADLPTYYCGDVDQWEQVRDQPDQFTFRPTHDVLRNHTTLGPKLQATRPADLLDLVRRHPEHFVGQQIPSATTHPWWDGSRWVERPARLSLFAFCVGSRIEVPPAGLTVLGTIVDGRPEFPAAIGDCVDTVVLRSPDAGSSHAPRQNTEPGARLSLGSRAAENLFWIGRYAERAENTARMVVLMTDVGLEEVAARDRDRWFPLWQGLLEATGHTFDLPDPEAAAPSEANALHMVLERANPSSVHTSVELVRENTRRTRDFFSPESWRVINRLGSRLGGLADAAGRSPVEAREATVSAIDDVLVSLPAFLGTIDRTMPHDAGWRFLKIGLHLERAIMTCAAVRHVLASIEATPPDSDAASSSLSSLIRMLGSQDAYRRTFQSASAPALVAAFFLRQQDSPQSVDHCLGEIISHLAALEADASLPPGTRPPIERACSELQYLRSWPLDAFFSTEPVNTPTLPGLDHADTRGSLAQLLEELIARFFAFSDDLTDTYLSHQARFAPPAPAATA